MAYASVSLTHRAVVASYLSISISHEIPTAKGDRKSVPSADWLCLCALAVSLAEIAATHPLFYCEVLPHRDPACRDTHHRNVTRSYNGCSGERTDPRAHRHRPSSRRVPACVATSRLGATAAPIIRRARDNRPRRWRDEIDPSTDDPSAGAPVPRPPSAGFCYPACWLR